MANTLALNGFSPIGVPGSSPNFELMQVKIASGNSTKIFHGDPVKQLSTGYIAQWTPGTSVAQLAGIFIECKYISVSRGVTVFPQYWPGTDAAQDAFGYILPLIGTPAMRFQVQSSGAAITLGNIGNNVDVFVGTGNTRSQQGGAGIDPTTIASTATLPFRIVGLMNNGVANGVNGSDSTTPFNIAIVQANVAALAGI